MDRTVKEPVRLREKKLANGNVSLYLDIYVNGRRSYEFLKLYLVPERSRADKERNRQTLQLANAIKAKRIVEAQSNAHGFANVKDATKVRFFDFFRACCEEERKEGSRGSYDHWMSCLRHLEVYERDDSVTFVFLTKRVPQNFLTNFQAITIFHVKNFTNCLRTIKQYSIFAIQ